MLIYDDLVIYDEQITSAPQKIHYNVYIDIICLSNSLLNYW